MVMFRVPGGCGPFTSSQPTNTNRQGSKTLR